MIPPVPTSDPMRSPTPASPGRCPSWRAAALLALVAGVSSGITLAVVGTGDDHNASSSTDEPSVWQDTRTYPDDAQNSESTPSPSPVAKSYGMGEKAKNGGATVVVKKVSESATLAIDRYGEAKTLKAGTGAKYVVVETTVYNDGTASFDPVCGGGISRGWSMPMAAPSTPRKTSTWSGATTKHAAAKRCSPGSSRMLSSSTSCLRRRSQRSGRSPARGRTLRMSLLS